MEDLAVWTEWVYGNVDVLFTETHYDSAIFVSHNETVFDGVDSIISYRRNAINKPFRFAHEDMDDLNVSSLVHNKPELNRDDINMFFRNAVLVTTPECGYKLFLNKIYAYNKHN